ARAAGFLACCRRGTGQSSLNYCASLSYLVLFWIELLIRLTFFFLCLREHGFDDAHRRFRLHHLCKPQTGPVEKRRVFGLRALSPSGTHEHHQVEHFAWMGLTVRREHHLNDQQSAARLHRAPAIAQNREILFFRPIVDDVREHVCVATTGDSFEETT